MPSRPRLLCPLAAPFRPAEAYCQTLPCRPCSLHSPPTVLLRPTMSYYSITPRRACSLPINRYPVLAKLRRTPGLLDGLLRGGGRCDMVTVDGFDWSGVSALVFVTDHACAKVSPATEPDAPAPSQICLMAGGVRGRGAEETMFKIVVGVWFGFPRTACAGQGSSQQLEQQRIAIFDPRPKIMFCALRRCFSHGLPFCTYSCIPLLCNRPRHHHHNFPSLFSCHCPCPSLPLSFPPVVAYSSAFASALSVA